MPFDHAVINTGSRDLFLHFADTRQHAHQTAKPAHFLQLANLRQKIIHVELALGHAFCQPFGFFNLDGFRCFFDKRDNIAHIQYPTSKARRIKFFKRVLLFANTGKFDRAACNMAHRQGSTTARITIKTGKRNAGNANSLMESFGCIDRILSGHRIGNKQDLMRVGCRFDIA